MDFVEMNIYKLKINKEKKIMVIRKPITKIAIMMNIENKMETIKKS